MGTLRSGGMTASEERRASWDELFFDLVAVAGVAALAHILIGELSWTSLGLYALLFLAFWQTWTAFMLFGNIGGESVRLGQLLVGMFGIGVMSAAIPGVAHEVLARQVDERSTHAAHVFALAYFLTRIAASRAIGRKLVIDFPIVQQTFGTLPWLGSVFVNQLGVVIMLWCIGIAIDLFGIIAISGQDVEREQERRYQKAARRTEKSPLPDSRRAQARLELFRRSTVSVSADHLAERLGLFVIIVLGEGVVQVVTAASGAALRRGTALAGLLAFALLAAIFTLSVRSGYAGVPHLRPDDLPVRFALGLHAVTSATIAALAVGLASVIAIRGQAPPDDVRWLLCGAVATYLTVGLAATTAARSTTLYRAVPWLAAGLITPAVIALTGPRLAANGIVALLLGSVVMTLALSRERSRSS